MPSASLAILAASARDMVEAASRREENRRRELSDGAVTALGIELDAQAAELENRARVILTQSDRIRNLEISEEMLERQMAMAESYFEARAAVRVSVGIQTASSGPLATGVVLAAAAANEGNDVLRSLCDAAGLLDAACAAIDATVAGEAVLMTAYTFDHSRIVEALFRGTQRGAHVLLLLDLDCNANGATRN